MPPVQCLICQDISHSPPKVKFCEYFSTVDKAKQKANEVEGCLVLWDFHIDVIQGVPEKQSNNLYFITKAHLSDIDFS